MANMSHHIPIRERVRVLDKFSQKMTNSGHSLEVIRRSMISGVKGHIRKAARCEKEGKPFHRTAAASAGSRKTRKLTAKQSWFKNKPRGETAYGEDSESLQGDEIKCGRGRRGAVKRGRGKDVAIKGGKTNSTAKKTQPSTVLFCEYTKGKAERGDR